MACMPKDDAQDATGRVELYRLLIADTYELAGLSRATSEAIADDADGQTVARWHIMSVVSEEPLTVPAIARRLGLARQSVQRVVDDLADSRHVELRPNPAHRRSPLVVLTRRGRTSLRRLDRAAESTRADQLAAAQLTRADLIEARATIRTLIAMLDKPATSATQARRDQPGQRS